MKHLLLILLLLSGLSIQPAWAESSGTGEQDAGQPSNGEGQESGNSGDDTSAGKEEEEPDCE